MNYLERNKKQYLEDLKGLIAIQSYLRDVNVYPTQEMKDALTYMESLANRDGFKVYTNPEGYYGYIEVGQGEEMIGILGHVDVVPPGDASDWDTDPFIMTEKDNGGIYGRGTSDDKGPVIMAYYLMKELVEEGIELNKRIRLIYPTDEETFWRGVNKYVENEELPTYGITPDSMFPVTYSERGCYQYKIKSVYTDLIEVKGGNAPNVVADKAKFINKETNEEISTLGVAAHAMKPSEGDNAITKLMAQLDNSLHPLINFVNNEIKNEVNGETLFGKVFSDDDAEMTVNLGVVNIDNENSYLLLDSRIPNTTTLEEIEALLMNKAEQYGLEFERYDWLKSVYIPRDSEIIKTLTDSYEEVTGERIEPAASGGATYARSMDNIVAFGPLFKESPRTEHQNNEYFLFNDYVKAYDIYKLVFSKWLK